MEKNKVIKGSNLPMKMPLLGSIVYLMAADYYNLPEWAWTCVILFLSLAWIVYIISIFKNEGVDVLNKK